MVSGWVIVSAVIILYLVASIKILREYERGVVFRLGRLLPKGERTRHRAGLRAD